METVTEVRCSFCGKDQLAVQRIVAGPGVYICDECVGLCVEILAAHQGPDRPEVPDWRSMGDQEILDQLPRIASAGGQVEASLRQWVGRLRERRVTWTRIGAALDMTRQSAWERFSGEE